MINMDQCVMCGRDLPTECGSMVCHECHKRFSKETMMLGESIALTRPNVELSFGANDGNYDFIVYYRRAKPLNRFQRWMFKVCFGICAKNV